MRRKSNREQNRNEIYVSENGINAWHIIKKISFCWRQKIEYWILFRSIPFDIAKMVRNRFRNDVSPILWLILNTFLEFSAHIAFMSLSFLFRIVIFNAVRPPGRNEVIFR